MIGLVEICMYKKIVINRLSGSLDVVENMMSRFVILAYAVVLLCLIVLLGHLMENEILDIIKNIAVLKRILQL